MTFRLMDLPLEIRLKVYKHALVPPAPIALSSVIYNLKDPGARHRPNASLLCASRQVNREAMDVFWAENVFGVDHETIFSLLKLFNPPRRRSNSSNASASSPLSGVSRGNVRSKMSEVRTIEYVMQCSLQKHPQLDPPGPRCVHVVFNSLSTLRDIVGQFCAPESPPRRLLLVLDAGSMPRDKVSEDNLLVDFEHKQLKKLNYKSEDPPWAEGDTVDVIAGALKGFALPHTVALRMETLLKGNDEKAVNGANGTNGTNEANGANGANGSNGVNKANGKELRHDVRKRDLTAVLTEKMGRRKS